MADPVPAFDFGKILDVIGKVVTFAHEHPDAVQQVTAFVTLVEQIIAAIAAAQKPQA